MVAASFPNLSFENPPGTGPTLLSSVAEPYALTAGSLLTVSFAGATENVVFLETDFDDIAAATAQEVADLLTLRVDDLVALDDGGYVRLTSALTGDDVTLSVLAGGANDVLGFPTTAAAGETYQGGPPNGWYVSEDSYLVGEWARFFDATLTAAEISVWDDGLELAPDLATLYDPESGSIGTPTGGVTYTAGALALDGAAGSRVQWLSPQNLTGLGFTFAAWVFVNTIALSEALFSVGSSAAGDAYQIRFAAADRLNFIHVRDGGGAHRQRTTTAAVPTGQWVHVVVTLDETDLASGVSIYFDNVEGTYATSIDGSGGTERDPDEDYVIGNTTIGTQPFDGQVRDVRVWSRQLSAAEVAVVFAETSDPRPAARAEETFNGRAWSLMSVSDTYASAVFDVATLPTPFETFTAWAPTGVLTSVPTEQGQFDMAPENFEDFEEDWGSPTYFVFLPVHLTAGIDPENFEAGWNQDVGAPTYAAANFDNGGEAFEDFGDFITFTWIIDIASVSGSATDWVVTINGIEYVVTTGGASPTAAASDLAAAIDGQQGLTAVSVLGVVYVTPPNYDDIFLLAVSPTGGSHATAIPAVAYPDSVDNWTGNDYNPDFD